jgi:hypothetical protein
MPEQPKAKTNTIAVLAERIDAQTDRVDKMEDALGEMTKAVNHRNELIENRLTRTEEFDRWLLRVGGAIIAVGTLATAIASAVK